MIRFLYGADQIIEIEMLGKLVPAENSMEKAEKRLDQLRKTAVVGDIISPIDAEWEAIK